LRLFGADEQKAKYAGRNRTGKSLILLTQYDCNNLIEKRPDKNNATSLAVEFADANDDGISPPAAAGVELLTDKAKRPAASLLAHVPKTLRQMYQRIDCLVIAII